MTVLSELVNNIQVDFDVAGSGGAFGPKEIARHINKQVHNMVRKMVELDQNYITTRINVGKDSKYVKQIHSNEWLYTMPWWVIKIADVRRGFFSTTQSIGEPIHRASKFNQRGWIATSQNQISLREFSAAIDLTLHIAKLPVKLTLGTLPAQGLVSDPTTMVQLDADGSVEALLYPHERERDIYAGAIFENVTPGPSGGQVLRVLSSVYNGETTLTMDHAWDTPPATADNYELHAEIPTQHTRLLELLSMRSMFSARQNMDGVRAIREEAAEEWQSFIQHIRERDTQEPYTYVEAIGSGEDYPWYLGRIHDPSAIS